MTNDLNPAGVVAATIRICPERDGPCPHGMGCPYVIDRYNCKRYESLTELVPTASLPQPEGETADLVERLGYHHEHPVSGKMVLINPDGPKAADALTSLSQRLAVAEARLAVVEAERDEAKERHSAHVDYSIDLSRIIEALCRDRDPPEPKTTARYHFDMAIAHRRAAKAQLAHAREAAIEDVERVIREVHARGPASWNISVVLVALRSTGGE